MKKLTALILAAVLVLSLAACGTANNAATDTQPTNAPSSAAPDASAAPSGKVLVVYYSASGNTERVAKDIADAAGADLFEITPTEVYSDDDLNWRNSDSRVSREHDDESLRDVPLTTTEVPDWDSYDTVFIGYPIWWGTMPRIINTFLDTYDLSSKTVLPFCTSGSSGITQSVSVIRAEEPDADVRDGLRASSANDNAIEGWIADNGIGQ